MVTDNIVREPNKSITPDNFVVKVRQCLYGVIVLLVNNKREPESQTGDIDGALININTIKAFTNGVTFECVDGLWMFEMLRQGHTGINDFVQ